jgi:hypothetical protein
LILILNLEVFIIVKEESKMLKRNVVIIVLTAVFITLPLAYFALKPTYFAEILLSQQAQSVVQIQSKKTFTKVDGDGRAFFEFRASTSLANGSKVTFEIKPDADPQYHPQGKGFKVDNGMIVGICQLASKEWPLHQNEKYIFHIVNVNQQEIMHGEIIAMVYSIAGSSQLVIGFIGLLASILQIIQALWQPKEQIAP